ncbi:hypothetical protein [Salinibacter ruber]|uniref:hypothetical protein n=1 Tax=Salinibacter ruber TaxID=146919 RepID=UPI001F07D6CB|nr:hypothetical protein [Salinibacter ruber]
MKAWEEERDVLFHGQEPPATDTIAGLVTEDWILNNYAQAEGVTDLDKVLKRGTGGCARDVAICSPDWKRGVTIDEAPGAPLPGFAAAAERARRPAPGPGGLGTVPPRPHKSWCSLRAAAKMPTADVCRPGAALRTIRSGPRSPHSVRSALLEAPSLRDPRIEAAQNSPVAWPGRGS